VGRGTQQFRKIQQRIGSALGFNKSALDLVVRCVAQKFGKIKDIINCCVFFFIVWVLRFEGMIP
jgi:hypothetical protein